MELKLTDSEAMHLIKIVKNIASIHKKDIDLTKRNKDSFNVVSFKEGRLFIVSYFITNVKVQISFMDDLTKHVLVRINLDNNFHKNSDGNRVYGHRVNIFSESEFIAKNDGSTYYKCFPIPYDGILDPNPVNLTNGLHSILNYTNTDYTGTLFINELTSLFV